jgi:hypothetical protein
MDAALCQYVGKCEEHNLPFSGFDLRLLLVVAAVIVVAAVLIRH